ncbi:MAG: DUF2784 family protein, partial [bacterium]|nr:DUF2784 family protein [bacterium]
MDYNVAADIVALSHLSIIILVFIGILVSIRFKRFRPFETAFLVVAIVLWSIYGNCPLTILEEHFRTLAGNPSGITSIGFIP